MQRRSSRLFLPIKMADELHRNRRQHHRAGFRDGAATCAFSQRQETCAYTKRHLSAADPVVSVAEASVSQLAGTGLEMPFSPIAQPRGPSDESQGARDGLAGNSCHGDFDERRD